MESPPLVDGVPDKGVQFLAPPSALVQSIQLSLERAVAQLPPDAHGAIVSIATTAGWNAAIVAKAPRGWNVQAYVGSKWGAPVEGGVSVGKVW